MAVEAPRIAVSASDYLYFTDRAVRGMAAILVELGDEHACSRPSVPGANTPFGLLTHCLAVIEYWVGYVVAGRQVSRNRPAEFQATGTVAELLPRVDQVLLQLAGDLHSVESAAPLRNEPDAWTEGPDRPLTQAAALIHVYEEMAQHHGQLEILRDILLAEPEPKAEPEPEAEPEPKAEPAR
jgi:uncharacterized damage-inducible protein DinB